MQKSCTQCGIVKDILEYHKDSSKKSGYKSSCKSCSSEKSSQYYLANAEKIGKKVSVYRKSYVPRLERDVESRLRSLRTKARCRKKKEFDISESDLLDLWENQKGRCAYTGLPLIATANQPNTMSLDRVDSSIGYVVGNIQLVCSAINKMKQEYSEDLFILLCQLVTQNSKLSELPESLLARYIPLGTSECAAPNKISLCSNVERI